MNQYSLLFDNIISIKYLLDSIDNRWYNRIYKKLYIAIIKSRCKKIKKIVIDSDTLAGFYNFVKDIDIKVVSDKLNYFILYINPIDEKYWARTIKIDYKDESIMFTLYNGDIIDIIYSNKNRSYSITVEGNLYNFEYTKDKFEALSRCNTIAVECIYNYIESYLER